MFTCMLLVANSTPIVDFDSKLNSFLVNLASKLLFPTPESPIKTTKTKQGVDDYSLFFDDLLIILSYVIVLMMRFFLKYTIYIIMTTFEYVSNESSNND